jgi:hypothetical protein
MSRSERVGGVRVYTAPNTIPSQESRQPEFVPDTVAQLPLFCEYRELSILPKSSPYIVGKKEKMKISVRRSRSVLDQTD